MNNDKLQITISKIRDFAKEFDRKVYVTDSNIFKFDMETMKEDSKKWQKQISTKCGN